MSDAYSKSMRPLLSDAYSKSMRPLLSDVNNKKPRFIAPIRRFIYLGPAPVGISSARPPAVVRYPE